MASKITNEKRFQEILEEINHRPKSTETFKTQCQFRDCARVKNDDTGTWESPPEGFNWDKDMYQYSHGVCPDCKPKFYESLGMSEQMKTKLLSNN